MAWMPEFSGISLVRIHCSLWKGANSHVDAGGNDEVLRTADRLVCCAKAASKTNLTNSAPVGGPTTFASMLHEVLSEEGGDAVVMQHVAAALAVPKGAIKDVQR